MEKQRTMGNEEPEDADLGAEVEQAGIVGAGNGVGDVDAVVGAAGNADTATMDAIEDQGASSDGPAAGGCDQRFDEVDDEGRGGGRASGIAAVAMAAAAVGCLAWVLSTQPLAPDVAVGSGSARLGSAPVEQEEQEGAPASDPVRVSVKLRADGWEPSAGSFTLVVSDMDGHEVSRLAVMPEGNGGMAARDAIELLPEAQFDSVRGSYTGEGVDGVSDEPVLELAPGEYGVEVVDAPVLADGSVYRLPGKARLEVADGRGAMVELTLERVDPADDGAVEAAIEKLPEGKREEAREQQKQNQQSGGGSTAPSGGNGGSGTSSGGGSNGGGGSTPVQPEKPGKPSHTHVFDIPVTESRWQDGEGYQRIERWMCSACKQQFGSSAEISNHIHSTYGDEIHPNGASSIDNSYDTWTKEPGYYDVVVGYKCSCGAMG